MAVIAVAVIASTGPIVDVDSYWHIVLGREILAGTSPAMAGRGWSFAPVPDTWVSTQWLAEAFFAWLDAHWGLRSLLVFRAVSTLAVLGVLGLVTLRRRPVSAGIWLFLIGAFAAAVSTQERSQQVTFALAPLIGWWAERTWRSGSSPQWWVVLPLVIVWSNVHGGWMLLPLALVLAAVARFVDFGVRDTAAVKAILLALLAVAASAVSPQGFGNTFASLRFSSSTARIVEWLPLQVWNWASLPLVISFVVAVVCWARGVVRPTRGEVILVLTLLLLATAAWRNMTPFVLLLAPILTGTLARAQGAPDPRTGEERLKGGRVAGAMAVVGVCLAVTTALLQSPVIPADAPVTLIQRLASVSAPQRVLNDYNVAGLVLYLAGPSPRVVLGIDGRADRFGAKYIEDYDGGLMAGRPGWRKLVEELAPTAALLRTDSALPELLEATSGWVEVAKEGDWVLLRPPGETGWAASA